MCLSAKSMICATHYDHHEGSLKFDARFAKSYTHFCYLKTSPPKHQPSTNIVYIYIYIPGDLMWPFLSPIVRGSLLTLERVIFTIPKRSQSQHCQVYIYIYVYVPPGSLTVRPWKYTIPKGRLVFQPSFFRGELLNFGRVYRIVLLPNSAGASSEPLKKSRSWRFTSFRQHDTRQNLQNRKGGRGKLR